MFDRRFAQPRHKIIVRASREENASPQPNSRAHSNTRTAHARPR